jgi:hypothetical protein
MAVAPPGLGLKIDAGDARGGRYADLMIMTKNKVMARLAKAYQSSEV